MEVVQILLHQIMILMHFLMMVLVKTVIHVLTQHIHLLLHVVNITGMEMYILYQEHISPMRVHT